MSVILPKPTEYKRARYRSRTEARWAVFLDSLYQHWVIVYEPDMSIPPANLELCNALRKYQPDFLLARSEYSVDKRVVEHSLLFWEVKPSEPTESYVNSLTEYAVTLIESYSLAYEFVPCIEVYVSFLLGVGSFYHGALPEFKAIDFEEERFHKVRLWPLENIEDAALQAANYRFDLK